MRAFVASALIVVETILVVTPLSLDDLFVMNVDDIAQITCYPSIYQEIRMNTGRGVAHWFVDSGTTVVAVLFLVFESRRKARGLTNRSQTRQLLGDRLQLPIRMSDKVSHISCNAFGFLLN